MSSTNNPAEKLPRIIAAWVRHDWLHASKFQLVLQTEDGEEEVQEISEEDYAKWVEFGLEEHEG